MTQDVVIAIDPNNALEAYRRHHGHGMHAEVLAKIERLQAMVDALLNHCDKECGECSECGRITCPHKDSMHFHHDGCPSCSQPSGSLAVAIAHDKADSRW